MLVHLNDELLHVRGRRSGRLSIVHEVGVGDHELVDSVEFGVGVREHCGMLVEGQAGGLQQLAQRVTVVCSELGEYLDPGLLCPGFDVGQVGVGYAGVGLYLPEGPSPPEAPEYGGDRGSFPGNSRDFVVLAVAARRGPLLLDWIRPYVLYSA